MYPAHLQARIERMTEIMENILDQQTLGMTDDQDRVDYLSEFTLEVNNYPDERSEADLVHLNSCLLAMLNSILARGNTRHFTVA